ncbi:MAG: ROK family protein, partial [Acidimicrobiales bacterium]
MTGASLIAALDVGGTKTLAVVADAGRTPMAWHRRPTTAGDPDALLATMIDAVSTAARRAEIEPSKLAAIGIGLPGVVDPVTGEVRHAVNLGIGAESVAVAERIERRFGVPVIVENDASAAAVGAARVLDADGDLAYLSIGTGVAVGLVLDGALRRGWRGAAGEIGHLPVAADGPRCECGQRGCLEVVASGSAIGRRRPMADGESPAAALFAAARRGNADAIDERDRLADHLAVAITVIALTVDPRIVVLGGGVAE